MSPLAFPILRIQPDDRLVRLCREGHGAAFEEIARRYREGLVRFARGIVPVHRAEDVVQEALIRAQRALASTHSPIALRPWLFTIVRNRALNDLRDERPHLPLDPEHDGVPQPPDLAAQREAVRGAVAGVQALPPAQRSAIVLRELEGRSHNEIAAAMGVSSGAVRQLIFRARAALRSGAGAVVPLPVIRALLSLGDPKTGASATGAGALAGAAAGGGGAVAAKGVAVLVAVLAVGSGVVLPESSEQGPERVAIAGGAGDGALQARERAGHASETMADPAAGGAAENDPDPAGPEPANGAGRDGQADLGHEDGGSGTDDSSGEGPAPLQAEPTDDHSGPGGDEDFDNSGPGSDSSGPGSGEQVGSGGDGTDGGDAGGTSESGTGGGGDGTSNSGSGDGGDAQSADDSSGPGPGDLTGDLAADN